MENFSLLPNTPIDDITHEQDDFTHQLNLNYFQPQFQYYEQQSQFNSAPNLNYVPLQQPNSISLNNNNNFNTQNFLNKQSDFGFYNLLNQQKTLVSIQQQEQQNFQKILPTMIVQKKREPLFKEGLSSSYPPGLLSVQELNKSIAPERFPCTRSQYCTKVYKNANGLKYHLIHGICEISDQEKNSSSLVTPIGTPEKNSIEINKSMIPVELDENEDSPNSRHFKTFIEGVPESERRDKPYFCKVNLCGKRYKNENGVKYHAKSTHPNLDWKQIYGHDSETRSNLRHQPY
ncbi:hypothetical protein HDU92_004828 [Lobulomyces angularis]|nr:hypothetical protein HDU92_004828 [Lobulomyces angularis]